MYTVLSPAKTQNFDPIDLTVKLTKPLAIDDTTILWRELKRLTPEQLGELMNINDKLAQLNFERYQEFSPKSFKVPQAKPALFAFQGDVYRGLKADTLTDAQLQFAQEHIGILSGYYGLLRPLDLMQAYRLEMGTPLKNPHGKNLYQFWGDRISKILNKMLKTHKKPIILNLASNEYFKAIDQEALNADIITVDFKQRKDGKLKTFGMLAKYARGLMANYIAKNKVDTIAKLKKFSEEGYAYQEEMSDGNKLVFIK